MQVLPSYHEVWGSWITPLTSLPTKPQDNPEETPVAKNVHFKEHDAYTQILPKMKRFLIRETWKYRGNACQI